MMNRKIAFMLAFAVLLAGGAMKADPAAACACCGTWQVVGVADDDALNIRTGPGAGYRKIGSIPPGSACVIKLGPRSGRWARISYADLTGWVHTRYLRFMSTPQ